MIACVCRFFGHSSKTKISTFDHRWSKKRQTMVPTKNKTVVTTCLRCKQVIKTEIVKR